MKTAVHLALASAALLALPASAQFAKPEHAVKYRQSAMFVMNYHLERIAPMVNGRIPYDAQAAAEHADTVAAMSKLPWKGFIPGTEKLSKNTLPEIWTEQAKFRQGGEKLMAETAKLQAAAKTNNLDNLRAAFRATADTCKSCHDNFTTF